MLSLALFLGAAESPSETGGVGGLFTAIQPERCGCENVTDARLGLTRNSQGPRNNKICPDSELQNPKPSWVEACCQGLLVT